MGYGLGSHSEVLKVYSSHCTQASLPAVSEASRVWGIDHKSAACKARVSTCCTISGPMKVTFEVLVFNIRILSSVSMLSAFNYLQRLFTIQKFAGGPCFTGAQWLLEMGRTAGARQCCSAWSWPCSDPQNSTWIPGPSWSDPSPGARNVLYISTARLTPKQNLAEEFHKQRKNIANIKWCHKKPEV